MAQVINKYRWFSDPAHAWLEVNRSEIYALGIQDKITQYSYQNSNKVYLEEDCDASTFLDALEKVGIQTDTTEDICEPENESPVRRYSFFKK